MNREIAKDLYQCCKDALEEKIAFGMHDSKSAQELKSAIKAYEESVKETCEEADNETIDE